KPQALFLSTRTFLDLTVSEISYSGSVHHLGYRQRTDVAGGDHTNRFSRGGVFEQPTVLQHRADVAIAGGPLWRLPQGVQCAGIGFGKPQHHVSQGSVAGTVASQ